MSGSSLDELTDHKTSWNDEFAQIIKSARTLAAILDAILNN